MHTREVSFLESLLHHTYLSKFFFALFSHMDHPATFIAFGGATLWCLRHFCLAVKEIGPVGLVACCFN